MSKVFIINRGGHDYSPAEKFGELVSLSTGSVDIFKLGRLFLQFNKTLKDYTDEDYLLPCSLGALNILAGWIVGRKGKKLNLLLYNRDRYYVERNLNYAEVDHELPEEKEVSTLVQDDTVLGTNTQGS